MPILNTFRLVQAITTTDTTIHGNHPCHAGTDVCRAAPSALALMANAGSTSGFHTCRNSSVTISAVIDDSTSVSA